MLSLGTMVGVGFLGVDKKIGNDICLTSNMNLHRPLRASIKLVPTNKQSNETKVFYKICSTYPSPGSVDAHKCYKVEHGSQDGFMGIYCGWSYLRM
jgi:hypothetical protein